MTDQVRVPAFDDMSTETRAKHLRLRHNDADDSQHAAHHVARLDHIHAKKESEKK